MSQFIQVPLPAGRSRRHVEHNAPTSRLRAKNEQDEIGAPMVVSMGAPTRIATNLIATPACNCPADAGAARDRNAMQQKNSGHDAHDASNAPLGRVLSELPPRTET